MEPARESLVLASSSPRRAALLAELGLAFEVLACPLPEPAVRPPGVPPRAWAEALAYYKARAVAERRPGRWVLGADTLVVCGGRLLGKPADLDDARRMLELQAGRPTQVITGVGLVCCADGVRRLIGSEVTTVWMRDAPEERERYLMSGDWWGKAGAYGIQTVGDRLVERVAGSFSNVVGLPAELVQVMLRTVGLAVRPGPAPAGALDAAALQGQGDEGVR